MNTKCEANTENWGHKQRKVLFILILEVLPRFSARDIKSSWALLYTFSFQLFHMTVINNNNERAKLLSHHVWDLLEIVLIHSICDPIG
jgi:hypothetical protein